MYEKGGAPRSIPSRTRSVRPCVSPRGEAPPRRRTALTRGTSTMSDAVRSCPAPTSPTSRPFPSPCRVPGSGVPPILVSTGALALLGLLDTGVKAVVARPRPPLVWQALAAHGLSFPSGHALWSAGALLLDVVLVGPIRGRWVSRAGRSPGDGDRRGLSAGAGRASPQRRTRGSELGGPGRWGRAPRGRGPDPTTGLDESGRPRVLKGCGMPVGPDSCCPIDGADHGAR